MTNTIDFGMHPAINEGIAQAFSEGLLTDANLMAPWEKEAEGGALPARGEE